MDLIRIPPSEGRPLIRGYGGGGFTIGAERIEGAVLLGSAGAERLPITAFDEIGPELIARIARTGPEILLIGAGEATPLAPLAEESRAILRAAAIGVEVMGTGPACRTFNVLLGEGRRVAALLLPVP